MLPRSSTETLPQGASAGVLSVSQLARQARIIIEERLGSVTVEGELSNFARPRSGHWYFTLKDSGAQIRCAMFAGRNRLVRLAVADGLQVRVSGRVSLYEARGDFQLIVDRMTAAGEGALLKAFEALKRRLAEEGLFDETRKRPLPAVPRHLTIISSPSGAALRDVLHVIERRFPALEVVLIPSSVQGDGAEAELLRALEISARLPTDLVLLTRGGGSLEDLWSFNLESVARAVAASPHPIVSAIGHQTDFAITDFVADCRAPTPSAAAEMITPDQQELARLVSAQSERLTRILRQEQRYRDQQLSHLQRRLVDPAAQVAQKIQQTDDLEARLGRTWRSLHGAQSARLDGASRSLGLLKPARLIQDHLKLVGAARSSLQRALNQRLGRDQLTLATRARALAAVSPLNTLERGYAVLTRPAEAGSATRAVTSVHQASPGDRLRALLADGSLDLTVAAVDGQPPLATPALTDEG